MPQTSAAVFGFFPGNSTLESPPTPSGGKNAAQPINITSENVQRPIVAPMPICSTSAPRAPAGEGP